MTLIRFFSLLLFSIVVCACSSTKAYIDYDSGFEFVATDSFNILRLASTEDGLSDRRIALSIRDTLVQRGWQERPRENANMLVRYSFHQSSKANEQRVSIGLGTGSVGRSGGISVGGSVDLPVGEQTHDFQHVQIEFIANDQVVWRGSDAKRINKDDPKGVEAAQLELVSSLLSAFPPVPEQTS